jgi:ketosteroid isomerase-like protein
MSESAALRCWLNQAEAGQRGDWDAVMGCLAPDCEWTLTPTGLRLSGAEAILNFMRAGMAAGERAPPQIKSAFGTERDGVFEYVSRGVGTASAADFAKSLSGSSSNQAVGVEPSAGASYEFHVCFVFHLDEDGRIAKVREYFAALPPAA